jgi:hypothetical protein
MNTKIILCLIGVLIAVFPFNAFGAGACCDGEIIGLCFIANDEFGCTEGGDETWLGDGTVCDPNPCPQPIVGDCDCYKVTCTDLDHPLVITHNVELCFDREDNEGVFGGLCNEEGDMSLFFGLIKQALAYTEGVTAHLKFHGSWPLNVVTGDVYCYGDRWKAWGHVTDYNECADHILPD